MEAVRIVLLAVGAAVSYGVVHDQVTARVCIEYFTVAHPPIFRTQDPTLLALGWGVIATWWGGLVMGVPLSVSARAGRLPKLAWRDLRWPFGVLLLVMAILATTAGVLGYQIGGRSPDWVPEQLPPDRHRPFLADLCAHNASYASGFLGSLVLCVWIWIRRFRLRTVDSGPGTVD